MQPHQSDKYPTDRDPNGDPNSELAALLRSPTIPSSPAPAYSALPPYRDAGFHLAPLINGRVGDVELETVDGKRFLVHRKLLEQETVFFHIYYGFVPVWRLHGTNPSVPAQAQNASQQASPGTGAQGALNNLFCLPKLLSHLRSSPTPTSPPPGIDDPPPLPPKDTVTAPTPRTNPYTWLVPETAPVLEGFLSLIYPSGTFTPFPTDPLITLELTGRVIRAALGYQSAKALALARDHMSGFMMDRPVDVYAMASFFKFTDLAKLASQHGIGVPSSDWGGDTRALLGRGALARLEELQGARMGGLREIVNKEMEVDEHSAGCGKRGRLEEVWKAKVRELELGLRPDSELFELLAIDLSGEHCENCLVQLGMTIQRCLYEARELPRSV